MASQAGSKTTTDREEIRKWAEERGAQPSCVRGTGGKGDIGMLRLDFPGYSGEQSLEHIDWDDWFDKFEERGLALLYQDTTAAGEKSNFNKIVSRETAAQAGKKASAKKASSSGRAGASKKAVGKKAAGKKAAAKKAPGKKVPAKKASAKKAPVKKAASKKSAAKKKSRR